MPVDERERLQHVVAHGIERAGENSEIELKRVNAYVEENAIKDYNRTSEHQKIIRGAMVCNVGLNGWIRGTIKRCQDARKFIAQHEAMHGTDPLVFVSCELLWGCHEHQEPTFREFSTLCGINSIVGLKKRPVLIRRSMIVARQLGYKSPAVHQSSIRPDQKALTTQQLRDTLDALESRDLIARFPSGHSNIYFGTGMSYDELKTAVGELRQKKNKIALRRELERNQAGTKKEPMKKKLVETGKKEPMKKEEPIDHQDGTKAGTKGGTKTGTNEIKASLRKAPLTNDFQINGETTTKLPKLSDDEIEAGFQEVEGKALKWADIMRQAASGTLPQEELDRLEKGILKP